MCFRCRKIAYRGGIGADKDWCDACGYGSCGSGDAWVAKARRCAPEGTSSGSAQVPPHWQGQGRGPSEPTPAAKPSYKAPPPSWAPRQPSQPPPQPKHPPRHTREEQAGGPRQPKPTPLPRGPLRSHSLYEEDERWASGGYPSTPPWDMPDDPPRASGPKKGAATSRATAGSGDASPPESRQDNTWGWACNHCGRENHLLKGRCGSCQEVKTAQASLPPLRRGKSDSQTCLLWLLQASNREGGAAEDGTVRRLEAISA